jgi:hypothetical protein
MTGKDVKLLWNRIQAPARVGFNQQTAELVTIYWGYVLDALLGRSWKNKSIGDAIALIDDNQEVPQQTATMIAQIERICRQQSPFAQSISV